MQQILSSIVVDIDQTLDRLVQKIELLSYINPTNIEEQKLKFFSSKYLEEPVFTYPLVDFNRFTLHKELFALPIEQIEDPVLRQFYKDIVYGYSALIQCIETIGEGQKFYFNSLRSFGTPTELDVENAKFILHFDDEENPEYELPKYSPQEAEVLFRSYSEQYDFSYEISYSDKMSAIAMVLNNVKTLVLNLHHTYSENEIGILTNHEIGVHMVTTMNGRLHPLKIFSHGFPNNEETQEGLAVFAEYMSGNLTIKRLKKIAFRVIAVDSLSKGYNFSQTFRLLHNHYDLDRETAFGITLRVHRGGGFTKDYLYLSGLKKIKAYYDKTGDLSLLLTGKTTLAYEKIIRYLIDQGYAVAPRHLTDSFVENNNKNQRVAFILENLK